MKRISAAATLVSTLLFAFLFFMIPETSLAVDCNSPPTGSGGNWARKYKSWCESCGGTYNPSNQSCSPGPNWGGGSSYQPPSYDYEAERRRQEEERIRREEAERQRQREIEEERKREEEAARKRQEEFERGKQEALKSMKGIAEGELGLKGSDSGALGLKDIGDQGAGGLGLKELGAPGSGGIGLKDAASSAIRPEKPDCEWGDMSSSVVDLRCLGLDPDKPISVDPHVARGKERVFPAQIDPETFRNANYNKGFEALKRFDVASAAQAIEYFERARKERPNDPMVRNGLLLAQDIHKARQQKEKDNQAIAAYFTLQGYASMMMGDTINARHYAEQARQFDPSNNQAKFVESLSRVDLGSADTYPRRKEAYQLVSGSLVSIHKQHYPVALDLLEAAQRLQPQDRFIEAFLGEMRKKHEAGRNSIK